MANYFGGARILNSESNCKLSSIEYIRNVKRTKETYTEFFKGARALIYINTIYKEIVDFIKENFEVYSISKIPAGYSNGYQWHIILRNPNGGNYNVRPPEKKIVAVRENMSTIETILSKALVNKGSKKKADIIREVIENLK